MQQGKGDASGMFGGGSSGAVFGASGAGNFITKLTTFLVVLFFLNCLALAYLAKSKVADSSIIISNDSSITEEEANDNNKESNSGNKPLEDIVRQDGVTIFVDPLAMMYIFGSTMDYVEDKMQSSFVFDNPNETGRCGCGESFSVG